MFDSRIFSKLLLVWVVAITTTTLCHAEESSSLAPPELTVTLKSDSRNRAAPSPIVIELLTMGPGDHPFYKFGHNALRVRDSRTHTDTVYNFGTFAFDSPSLLYDFFKGLLRYWLSTESFRHTIGVYRDENRSLIAQRLDLGPAEAQSLADSLATNALPANRSYQYDYFFDNCSTRLRDAIDRVTMGQVHAALKVPSTHTLRDHALRSTSDYFLEYLVLNVGLGPLVDRKIDRWTEAFLPEMLAAGMRQVVLRNAEGNAVPLVKQERTILRHLDKRPATAPKYTSQFLLAGAVLGLSFVVLGWFSRRYRATAVFLGLILLVHGLVIGLVGLGLVALWALTNHAVTYGNQNILLFSPMALALPWYGIKLMAQGSPVLAKLRGLSALILLFALGALLLKALPVEWQDNGNLIAFFVPSWTGLWLTVTRFQVLGGVQRILAFGRRP